MHCGRQNYFSVDFDATPAQQTPINAYFDGVVSVIGLARTGAYGGYYVIKRLFDGGKIKWGWQTYAWSGGQWDSRAQLRQVQNGITAAGDANCCDKDEAVANDYGQWHAVPPNAPPRGTLDAKAWAFSMLFDVAPEPDAVVAAYPVAADWSAKPSLVQADDGTPEVWLIDGATRRHVVSAASLAAWHRTAAEVVKTAAAKVQAYP